MHRFFFFLILTVFGRQCLSAKDNRIYYDSSWQKADKVSAFFYLDYERQTDIYQITDYRMDGTKFGTGFMTSLETNSYVHRTGLMTWFDPSGHPIRSGNYSRGRRNGQWSYYYQNSDAIKSTINYIDDSEIVTCYFDSATQSIDRVVQKNFYLSYNWVTNREMKLKEKDTVTTSISFIDPDSARYNIDYYDNGKKKSVRIKNRLGGGTDTVYYGNGVVEKYAAISSNKEQRGSHSASTCFDSTGLPISCDSIHISTNTGFAGNTVFPFTQQMPTPMFNLLMYLSTSLHYPDKARENNTQGKAIVKFIVDEDGSVSNVTIVKHVSPEIDAEAIRVVTEMPAWHPGKQNGVAVRVYFSLPVGFSLH